MRQPPAPHFTSTIPSLRDGTPLCIRIYHPKSLSKPRAFDPNAASKWTRKKAIIMAHPYAPMGGCYDDRVVGIVVEEFVHAGWIVGTFNFRGAHGSKGHTSWSGKPELEDYASFAGFFMHYLSWLKPLPVYEDSKLDSEPKIVSEPARSQRQLARELAEASPILCLGGYSYGSLILKHLPPLPSLVQPFASPDKGTAADDILIRARALSDEVNLEWLEQARRFSEDAREGREASWHTTAMGSGDQSLKTPRKSLDVRHSLDIRRSFDAGSRLLHLNHHGRDDKASEQRASDHKTEWPQIAVPIVRYLLISPLFAPISAVLAPGLAVPRAWAKSPRKTAQDVLVAHKTLIVYGTQDVFTAARKVRGWLGTLQAVDGNKLECVEVEGAGHFWSEDLGTETSIPVARELRRALQRWARSSERDEEKTPSLAGSERTASR